VLSKKEPEDILDPREDPTCSGPHLLPAEPDLDFPGETFRVLKEKEERQFGEYRTRRLVLEAWERLHREGLMPEPYDQRLQTGDRRLQTVRAAADADAEQSAMNHQRSVIGVHPCASAVSHPQSEAQPPLVDDSAVHRLKTPDIIPGATCVLVNGQPAVALSCEEVTHQGKPVLQWTVILDTDSQEHKYVLPPANVEVVE